jgi:hypothetical protein
MDALLKRVRLLGKGRGVKCGPYIVGAGNDFRIG